MGESSGGVPPEYVEFQFMREMGWDWWTYQSQPDWWLEMAFAFRQAEIRVANKPKVGTTMRDGEEIESGITGGEEDE